MNKKQLKEILQDIECELYDTQVNWSEYMLKREILLLIAKKLNVNL